MPSMPQPILKDSKKQEVRRSRRCTTETTNGGDSTSPSASPVQRVSFDRSTVTGPPIASSNRLAGLNDSDLQKVLQATLIHRRTSLPVSSSLIANRNLNQSNVSEARGLIVDMLNDRELPPSVTTCLRVVANLLNPQPPPVNLHMDFGLPMVVENPYSGEQLVVSAASKPRASNITFSTVTSATGLPTIAAEPSRPRSSSYWKPHEREVSQTSAQNEHHATSQASSDFIKNKETSSEFVQSRKPTFSKHATSKYPSDAEATLGEASFSGELGDDVVQTNDGIVFDSKELDNDENLQRISEWGFPIFQAAERHRNTVLTRLTYSIFKQFDLFRIFRISLNKFFNFFHDLERGYWDIPYHNRIHAADVLHGCYYLTCHPVRAFVGCSPSPDSSIPSLENSPLPISESMSTLELMALFTAATMHDYDHPGRTNAFLVACEDVKAIMYNDRSVLENHHAAESWRLLSKPGNTFIDTLDPAETKRFRYLVLEYILATDLKQHFDIIVQFNEKASSIDLNNESDRVLISQMLIKFADINSPSKPYPLHRRWTERICEEFFEQGDEEKRRGMAVSPYMDRNDPAVAKLQDSFIVHIVNPLAIALNEAGLLPILPGLEEPELLINLRHNHQKWLHELEIQNATENINAATTSFHSTKGGPSRDRIEEENTDNESDNHTTDSNTTANLTMNQSHIKDEHEMGTICGNEEEYL